MRTNEFYAGIQEIRILSTVLAKLLRQDLEQHLQTCGVSMGALQYGVLRLLAHQKHTISELSRTMMIEAATLVPVVDALERDGLVERGRDPQDRRRTPLLLTARGSELLKSVPTVGVHSALVKSLESMGAHKNEELLALLRELTANLSGDEEMVRGISESVRRQVARERFPHRREPMRVRAKNSK